MMWQTENLTSKAKDAASDGATEAGRKAEDVKNEAARKAEDAKNAAKDATK